MSKRYREVLEEVETQASRLATRRAADRDGAAVADEVDGRSPTASTGWPPEEAGTGTAAPALDEPGTDGGVGILVRPVRTTTTATAAGTTRSRTSSTGGPTTSSRSQPSRSQPPRSQSLGPRPARARHPGNGPADVDQPLAFTWRGRHYEVTRILGHWREEEGWWRRPDGEPIRIEQSDLWRVEAARGPHAVTASDGPPPAGHGVYELSRRGTTWRLDRVWD